VRAIALARILADATDISRASFGDRGRPTVVGPSRPVARPHHRPAAGYVARYGVTSRRAVAVRYGIVRRAGVIARVIRARAADGSEVRRRLIVIPGDPDRRIARTDVLTMPGRAVTGQLRECRAAPGR
jgi:hypothetical protein